MTGAQDARHPGEPGVLRAGVSARCANGGGGPACWRARGWRVLEIVAAKRMLGADIADRLDDVGAVLLDRVKNL